MPTPAPTPAATAAPSPASASPTPPATAFRSFLTEPLPSVSARVAQRAVDDAFGGHPGLREEMTPSGGTYDELITDTYCTGELWTSAAEYDHYAWRCSTFVALCLAYTATSDQAFVDAASDLAGLIKQNKPAYFDQYVEQNLDYLLDDPSCGY
jgi:hypothetical protein